MRVEDLPTNIAESYPDRSGGDQAHQEHHDTVHGWAKSAKPVVDKVDVDGTVSEAIAAGGFKPRGPWDPAVAYAYRDFVTHAGGSWVAQADTAAGDEPGVAPVWQDFAAGGVTTAELDNATNGLRATLPENTADVVTNLATAQPELQAALDAHYAASGGRMVTRDWLVVDDTVTLGTRVQIAGFGTTEARIQASDTFPTDGRPVVRLDRAADVGVIHSHHNLLEHLVVDCNNRAKVGVYSENVQEHGGLRDISVSNFTRHGVHFKSGQAMNFVLDDIWCYGSEFAEEGAIGVLLDGVGSSQPMMRATVVGHVSAPLAACVKQVGGAGMTYVSPHLEVATDGILVTGSTSATVIGASGHSTLTNVVVRGVAGARVIVSGTSKNGSAKGNVDRSAAAPLWAVRTTYALTDVVRPTTANGHVYECTVAGTSGTTEPVWPTAAGATVTDGTVTWTEAGAPTADDVEFFDDVWVGGGGQVVTTGATSRPTQTVQGAPGLTLTAAIQRVQRSDAVAAWEVRQDRRGVAKGGLRVEMDTAGGLELAANDGTVGWYFQRRPDLGGVLHFTSPLGRVLTLATNGGFAFGDTPVSKSTGWGTPTGTATKTTFDTTTVTVEQLAQRVKAMIDVLKNHGIFLA